MALKDDIRRDYALRLKINCFANTAPAQAREGEGETVILHSDHPDAIDRTEITAFYFRESKQYWVHEKGKGGLANSYDYWTGPYHLMRPEPLLAAKITSKDIIITVESKGNTGWIDFCAGVEETPRGIKVTFYRHTPDSGSGQETLHLSFTLGELGLMGGGRRVSVGNRVSKNDAT